MHAHVMSSHVQGSVARSAARSARLFPLTRKLPTAQRRVRVTRAAVDQPEIDPRYAAGSYPNWDSIHKQLTEKYRLQSVPVQEAAEMIEAGKAVLVDVRLKESFEEAHPEGAVNAPIFRVIRIGEGGGMSRLLKAAVMMTNGVTPTESNPDFCQQIASAAGSDKAVILACEAGGTISSTTNFATGKPSRSLKAAWRALYNGTLSADRVLHLQGGVLEWFAEELPMVGDYDASKAWSTPNAVKN